MTIRLSAIICLCLSAPAAIAGDFAAVAPPEVAAADLAAARAECRDLAASRHLSADQEAACVEETVLRARLERTRMHLFETHLACRKMSQERMLSRDEVDACAATFLWLKLSFLEGMTSERYAAMTPTLRATANRKGYDAFRAWQWARRDKLDAVLTD